MEWQAITLVFTRFVVPVFSSCGREESDCSVALWPVFSSFLGSCRETSITKAEEPSVQVLVRAVMPSDLAIACEDVSLPPNRALFKGFTQTLGASGIGKAVVAESIGVRFRAAETHETRCEVVVRALQEKLACALGLELDEAKSTRNGQYRRRAGVGSLIAVELRDWMRTYFGVAVLVFGILVGGSISNLSEMVTKKADETGNETQRLEERADGETNGVEGDNHMDTV